MNCWAISRATHDQDGRPVPQRAGHRRAACARHRRAVSRRSTTSAPGINHMAFYLRFERDGEDLYPQSARSVDEGRVPDGNRVRYEMLQAARLLRHRVERALRRVRALVHQARPARPDRRSSTSRSTSTSRRCEDQIAGWAAVRDAVRERRGRSRCKRSHEYGVADHPQHRDRQAARRSTATCRTRADRQPAAGLLRRGAVPGRQERRAADARSARCRRSSPR